MRRVVGILGFSGVGKTEVMSYLKDTGEDTIISDELIISLYKKNNMGYKVLKNTFKNDNIFGKDEINRKELGKIVFNNIEKLEALNRVIQPLLINEIQKKIASFSGTVFVESKVALDYPEFYRDIFDLVILVTRKKEDLEKNITIKFSHLSDKAKDRINNGDSIKNISKFKSVYELKNSTSKEQLKKSIKNLVIKLGL